MKFVNTLLAASGILLGSVSAQANDRVPDTEISIFKTCEEIRTKAAEKSMVLVYWGERGTEMYKAQLEYASEESGMEFYLNDEPECADEHESQIPGITLLRRFDDAITQYEGESKTADIKAWAAELKIPKEAFEFTDDIMSIIFNSEKPTLIMYRDEMSMDHQDFMINFHAASTEFQGKVLFCYSDVKSGMARDFSDMIGVTVFHLPTLIALVPNKQKKYEYTQTSIYDITVENIGKFIDDVLGGELPLHLKSEQMEEDKAGLKKVVSKNYH